MLAMKPFLKDSTCFLLMAFFIYGCSDNPVEPTPVGILTKNVTAISFRDVPQFSFRDTTFTIRNTGNASIEVKSATLLDTTSFKLLSPVFPLTLRAGDS